MGVADCRIALAYHLERIYPPHSTETDPDRPALSEAFLDEGPESGCWHLLVREARMACKL
jgi:hypothetical protein